MACPIEQPLIRHPELFGDEDPQRPLLDATTYEDFLMKSSCMNCSCCPVGETNGFQPPVMCDGNIRGRIVLIGEAPGREEREQGVPFVGNAGKKLKSILVQTGIPERGCYFINILKCRPFDYIFDKNDIRNIRIKDRRPKANEAAACFPLLQKQLSFATAAQYIIFLGESAAVTCLGLKTSYGVLTSIGQGVPLMIGGLHRVLGLLAPHPSYFCRNPADNQSYERTLSLFRNLRDALETRGKVPMTYHTIKANQFTAAKRPMYYKQVASVA